MMQPGWVRGGHVIEPIPDPVAPEWHSVPMVIVSAGRGFRFRGTRVPPGQRCSVPWIVAVQLVDLGRAMYAETDVPTHPPLHGAALRFAVGSR